MGKRRIRLDDEDLKAFLTDALSSSGYMEPGDKILGFEYKTKRIKKGGDYYKDGVDDPNYPGEVEEVVWLKALIETGRKPKEDDDAVVVADDRPDGGGGGEALDPGEGQEVPAGSEEGPQGDP